jgi:hypothetical protein
MIIPSIYQVSIPQSSNPIPAVGDYIGVMEFPKEYWLVVGSTLSETGDTLLDLKHVTQSEYFTAMGAFSSKGPEA